MGVTMLGSTMLGSTGPAPSSIDYHEVAKQFPGLLQVLKVHDMGPSYHLEKITPPDICAVLALLTICLVLFIMQNPPGASFWLLSGMSATLLEPRYESELDSWTPSFRSIGRGGDALRWLNQSLAYALFDDTSDFRRFNSAPGFLRLRQQRVKSESCERTDMEPVVAADGCYPALVSSATRETADISSVAGVPVQPRCVLSTGTQIDCGDPATFVDAKANSKDHRVSSLQGRVQRYDASGYQTDVPIIVGDTDTSSTPADFTQHLTNLVDAKWVDVSTRMLLAEFSAYNGNFDRWLSFQFLFELSPSHSALPTARIFPLRLHTAETYSENFIMFMDYLRLVLVLYVGLFMIPKGVRHKHRHKKAGYLHFLTVDGLVDTATVLLFFITFLSRLVVFQRRSLKSKEVIKQMKESFQSWSEMGALYDSMNILEGLLVLCLLIRIVTFFRLARPVYLLWRVLGRAIPQYIYFAFVFLPVFMGFVFAAHAIWGPYLESFESFGRSFISLMMFLNGNLNLRPLHDVQQYWTAVFVLLFFVVVSLLLVNVFIAIMVDAQYTVRITDDGQEVSKYRWGVREWINWMFPTFIAGVMIDYLAPLIPGLQTDKQPPHVRQTGNRATQREGGHADTTEWDREGGEEE